MSIEAVSGHPASTWRSVASRELSKLETRLFIDGEYVDAIAGERLESSNPAPGETIAAAAAANARDADAAVAAARRTFRSGAWSRMAPRERMEILYRFTGLIDEHAEQLAVLDTLNMGKPISDMLAIDLPSVIETFQFMAECIDKIEGSVTNTEA